VITMEMLGKIKRMYSRDKKSLREIAEKTGLSRNTIRKWVRAPQETQAAAPTYRRKEMPNKLTAFHQALELALKADAHRTKQNRRTAKALFTEIKLEGYTGGYSRVTDFTHWARVERGSAIPARAKMVSCLYSGKWSAYLATSTWANSAAVGMPLSMIWAGTGAWVSV